MSRFFDDKDGLDIEGITQDNDFIMTKTDDASESGASGWYYGSSGIDVIAECSTTYRVNLV